MKSGTISFDRKSGNASGLIIVDATSGDSGNHARDKKMHKEILESQRYREITFTPERVIGNVVPKGNSTIQVQGLFHIHGSDHDLTLSIPVEINGNEVKASTSFIVPVSGVGHEGSQQLSAARREESDRQCIDGWPPHAG